MVARTSDGIVVRTRAVNEMLAKTIVDDLNKISGTPWAPAGVVTEKVIVPRADSHIALNEMDEPQTFAPRSMLLTITIVHRVWAHCVMLQVSCTFSRERLERAVSPDPVLKRKLNDVEERKRKYLAVEVERAVNQASSVAERQLAKVPSTGGATSSSDPHGSTSGAILAQTFGRGQKRIIPEEDKDALKFQYLTKQ